MYWSAVAAVMATFAVALPVWGAEDKPASTDSPFVPAGYVKVFADEMDTPSLDISKWWTRYIYNNGKLDTLNDERQLFRENDNHVMKDGVLALTARIKPTDNPRFRYESGMIRSKKTFKYGYFEARLKLPKGLGTWPAFWLNSDADANGKTSWPPEVDILEFANNGKDDKPNMLHIAVQAKPKQGEPNPWEQDLLWADPNFKVNKSRGGGYYHAPFNLYDDWHVFATLWKNDDTFEFFLDGKPIAKFKYKWVYRDGRPAAHAHVLVNLSIGGQWAGRYGIDDAAFPQALEVDYVRVYQKPDEGEIGESTIGHDLLKPATNPAQ